MAYLLSCLWNAHTKGAANHTLAALEYTKRAALLRTARSTDSGVTIYAQNRDSYFLLALQRREAIVYAVPLRISRLPS